MASELEERVVELLEQVLHPLSVFTDVSPHLCLDAVANHLICTLIFSCCTPATLLRFSLVCHEFRAAIDAFFRLAFNIERSLLRFFSDPLGFRRLQYRTGTLISGSFALQFMARVHYPESDLDLYVHPGRAPAVSRWVLAAGYAFAPAANQEPDFDAQLARAQDPRADAADLHVPLVIADSSMRIRGVRAVYTFVKPAPDGDGARKVQVIEAEHAPMQVILRFHSTVVMNVISYEMAYALYPRATFEEQRALVVRTVGPSQQIGIAKYAARGWTMLEDLSDTALSFAQGSRWIDDAHAWSIPLCRTPAERQRFAHFYPTAASQPIRRDPAAVTNWFLRFRNGEPEMCFGTVRSRGLFYPYVLHDWVVEENLKTIFSRIVRMERVRARAEGEPDRKEGSSNWEYHDSELYAHCQAVRVFPHRERALHCYHDRDTRRTTFLDSDRGSYRSIVARTAGTTVHISFEP